MRELLEADFLSVLENSLDALERGYIFERVAVERDHVGGFALGDGAGRSVDAAQLRCVYRDAGEHQLVGRAEHGDIRSFLREPLMYTIGSYSELQAAGNCTFKAFTDYLLFFEAAIAVFRGELKKKLVVQRVACSRQSIPASRQSSSPCPPEQWQAVVMPTLLASCTTARSSSGLIKW